MSTKEQASRPAGRIQISLRSSTDLEAELTEALGVLFEGLEIDHTWGDIKPLAARSDAEIKLKEEQCYERWCASIQLPEELGFLTDDLTDPSMGVRWCIKLGWNASLRDEREGWEVDAPSAEEALRAALDHIAVRTEERIRKLSRCRHPFAAGTASTGGT